MREEIERVIADLEKRRQICANHGSYNRAAAFEYAIDQLKAVLANAANDGSAVQESSQTKAD